MSLKNLQEISSVVTNYTKKTRFEALEKGSKTDQLIRGLIAGTWENDEEAEVDLYGKSLNGRSFDMLKSRAKEQLINTVFLLDTKRRFKSSYDRAYFDACKNLLAGLILSRQGKDKLAIRMFEHSKKASSKFHFTEIEYWSNKYLKYFASLFGNKTSFEHCYKHEQTLLKTLDAESQCDFMNQNLIIEFVRSAAPKIEMIEVSRKYFNTCQEILFKYDNYNIRLNYYRIGIRYYDSCNNYSKLIELADECLNYLDQNPHFILKVRQGEMNLQKLYGCLHLRDYNRGLQYAESCKKLFNEGTLNWLIFLEYFFLLSLHTENSKQALTIFSQVIGHSSFKNYPPQSHEKWKIFEAFLNYALPNTKEHQKRFNVPRFVNEVPIFSKDKAGYNFSIIIAQVILLIKSGDFEKVVERAEALKLYASRYIRKEKSPRSYYFLKMLLVMIKYDFDPVKTEQIASKFYDKLKANHLGEQNELETLEVIPYDILWPKLLDQLKISKQTER